MPTRHPHFSVAPTTKYEWLVTFTPWGISKQVPSSDGPSRSSFWFFSLLPNVFHLIRNYMYKCIPGRLELTWGQGRVFPVFVSCPALGLGFPLPDSPWRMTADQQTWPLQFMSGAVFPHRLPRWLSSKESACNAGDAGSIPGSGRSPGGGHGNPLQCSCLENPMDPTEAAEYTHMSHAPQAQPDQPCSPQPQPVTFSCSSCAPFWLVASAFSLHPPRLGPSLLHLCYTFPLVQSFEGQWAGFSVSPPHGPSSLTFCPMCTKPGLLQGPCRSSHTLRTPAVLLWPPAPPHLDSCSFFL